MLTLLLVAPSHTHTFSTCYKVSGFKESTGEWKMLENDGHVCGEGDAGCPSSSCFDQRHYSFHLCIPQCPHLEGSSTLFFFCTYMP